MAQPYGKSMFIFVRTMKLPSRAAVPFCTPNQQWIWVPVLPQAHQQLVLSAPIASWVLHLDVSKHIYPTLPWSSHLLHTKPNLHPAFHVLAAGMTKWSETWDSSFIRCPVLYIQPTPNILFHFFFFLSFGLGQFSLAPLVPLQANLDYGRSLLIGLLVSTLFSWYSPSDAFKTLKWP